MWRVLCDHQGVTDTALPQQAGAATKEKPPCRSRSLLGPHTARLTPQNELLETLLLPPSPPELSSPTGHLSPKTPSSCAYVRIWQQKARQALRWGRTSGGAEECQGWRLVSSRALQGAVCGPSIASPGSLLETQGLGPARWPGDCRVHENLRIMVTAYQIKFISSAMLTPS